MQRKKYGEPIILVSGLPRSGTSMMMKMLEAGGLPIMTDNVRTADSDNPKGYYEYERVKDLDKPNQSKDWMKEARGKAIKIISVLLSELPDENFYQIIFMLRSLDEVLASQNKMLKHRNEEDKKGAEDEKMKMNYEKHLRKIEVNVFDKSNVAVLNVDYSQVINKPQECALAVNSFLDINMNVSDMAGVVDENLYRNRKSSQSS